MNKLPKCPRCGGNAISCLRPIKGKNSYKFEFSHYVCVSCDEEWNSVTREKVVFT